MNGDLLRTLEGPENCLKPKLIQASREGHCVVFYENGLLCTFSVNGKLQATTETADNVRVRPWVSTEGGGLPHGTLWSLRASSPCRHRAPNTQSGSTRTRPALGATPRPAWPSACRARLVAGSRPGFQGPGPAFVSEDQT